MTPQEYMRYQDQMHQMIKSTDDPELLKHYQDEHSRASKIVSEFWSLFTEQMVDKILERGRGN